MSAQIVSFNCLLKSMTGHLINSSVNSDVLNAVPSECSMLNGLAPGMQKVKKGEFRSITLKADQAYGSYDAKKVILYPRNKMAKNENISSGKTVSILSKTGTTRSYRVVQIYGDMVALDGNHPLAGQDLVFEIEITEARAATRVEIDGAQNMISIQALN